MKRQSISISFTELLYSVVIGIAITRIETLTLTRPTVLLVVALLVVFDDYILYHEEVDDLPYSKRNEILVFWLDLLVLAAWYALSLAANYPIAAFLFCLGAFFACTTLWEATFSPAPWIRRLWSSGDVPLALACLLLAAIGYWFPAPGLFYLIPLLPLFVWWRWSDWAVLLRRPAKAERANQQ